MGRVNNTNCLVAWGTLPLGAALGGALGQRLDVGSVLAIMGLVVIVDLIPNRRITERAISKAEPTSSSTS